MASFICLAGYFKGDVFLRSLKAQGAKVFLFTLEKLAGEPWPMEAIDRMVLVKTQEDGTWDLRAVISQVADLIRQESVDRIIALDDFDVDRAAYLREYFHIPGMKVSVAHNFRDKLAMRKKAQASGIAIPRFTDLFHEESIRKFLATVPPPWLIKPRGEAASAGIKKIPDEATFWEVLHRLGENRHAYLLEKFEPGDVYHVDSLTYKGEIVFIRVSKYLNAPLEVAQSGGVFRSATVPFYGEEDIALRQLTRILLKNFGLEYGASHTEFIRSYTTGEYYFLETAARVGGAHLSDMLEASTGFNIWAEWARMELALLQDRPYSTPISEHNFAGIVISLANQQRPDPSLLNAPEVCWKLTRDYHVGCIVKSASYERVQALLEDYMHLIQEHFHASAPPREKISQ